MHKMSNINNKQCIGNKAIRDGRPRPPRHQVGWDIPLHFDTNPESLRPFVPEIWPNNVFNLSATYDLDLWPKILKIFVTVTVYPYVIYMPSFIMIGWEMAEILHFEILRKHGQTHTQTHKQTDMGITIPRPPPMGGEVNMLQWQIMYNCSILFLFSPAAPKAFLEKQFFLISFRVLCYFQH